MLSFSDVYFNFDWQGIICNIGTENENGGDNDDFAMSEASVVKSERISSLRTQQDTLVGVFKDTEGRDGYMFVNYTEPSAGKKNKVTVTFNDCAGGVGVCERRKIGDKRRKRRNQLYAGFRRRIFCRPAEIRRYKKNEKIIQAFYGPFC